MKPRCYVVGGHADPTILAAFAKGCGGEIVDTIGQPASAVFRPGQPAVVWGLLRGSAGIIKLCHASGTPWIYIDHGYFRRGHFEGHYRCTLGGFQLNRVLPGCPDDRWHSHNIRLQKWRSGQGEDIIVCPPTGVVAETFGKQNWLATTLRAIQDRTKRRIVVRHKHDSAQTTLSEAVKTAHALVTYNSIAAVEAAVLGVPVIVHEKSAAAPVGAVSLDLIENPPMPDRAAWAASLSYAQFTLDEMRSGLAWAALVALQLGAAVAPVAGQDHGGTSLLNG